MFFNFELLKLKIDTKQDWTQPGSTDFFFSPSLSVFVTSVNLTEVTVEWLEFSFFFTHLVKSCQSFQTSPQTSSTREITCQTPSVKLVLIPTCPICWPQTIHGQYTGPTSWVALASLHQVKHFCLAHGTYVCTIDTKQDWTQPGSTFFFASFKCFSTLNS